MIQPVNNHLIIEPEKKDSFIKSERTQFQEVGVVISQSEEIKKDYTGKRVYFDSWLAAKFPKVDSPQEFFWLVKFDDVRAVEHVE